jgi:hypothetical protein
MARPSELNPAIDGDLEVIIDKATAPLPGDRYAVCQEFKDALENYARVRGVR